MALTESARTLREGDRAPAFSLPRPGGAERSLGDYSRYEALLVVFMCNHCPYVKAKVGAIREIHERFGDRVAVVGINSNDASRYPDDSAENMSRMAAEWGIRFDYLVDESQEVARAYGATCTPDPFLFDADRRLAFHGRIDDAMKPGDSPSEKTMAANIEALLSGSPIPRAFDPSIGCSIKWKEGAAPGN